MADAKYPSSGFDYEYVAERWRDAPETGKFECIRKFRFNWASHNRTSGLLYDRLGVVMARLSEEKFLDFGAVSIQYRSRVFLPNQVHSNPFSRLL
jgi:hypothetical protein